jgi:hypothetical protein
MNHDVRGDSIVAFIGPCDVKEGLMCDMVDVKERATIKGAKMLHFIVEHFNTDLEKGVLRQRLLMAIIKDAVNEQMGGERIRRDGDDLYDGERKFSVSIATPSPVSVMIHAGVNIDPAGAPVLAVGLLEYGLDGRELGEAVIRRYVAEMQSAVGAMRKVKGVP